MRSFFIHKKTSILNIEKERNMSNSENNYKILFNDYQPVKKNGRTIIYINAAKSFELKYYKVYTNPGWILSGIYIELVHKVYNLKFDEQYIGVSVTPSNFTSNKIIEYTINQIESLIKICDLEDADELIIHDIEYLYIINRLIRHIKTYDAMLYHKMFSSENVIDIHMIKSFLNKKRRIYKKIRRPIPNIFELDCINGEEENLEGINKWKNLFSYSPKENNGL